MQPGDKVAVVLLTDGRIEIRPVRPRPGSHFSRLAATSPMASLCTRITGWVDRHSSLLTPMLSASRRPRDSRPLFQADA
ncbi:MAG: hypothetical protein WA085_04780 [Sphingobium sp.]|uniref:hypothetical protein n=1 Tax=Sphingobium sp. CECT 9361 TaxID=2845384 RepID=UPI001E34E8C6|nr:hypothetical protein [Sphingobium sp. CECT 9361]